MFREEVYFSVSGMFFSERILRGYFDAPCA